MLRMSNELKEQLNFGCIRSSHFIYHLSKYKNTIGRNQSCNIVINHPSISKEHAVIEFDPHKSIVLIHDLASSNGTFVNDNKLSTSVFLHQNDRLRFGKDSTEYTVELYYQLPNSPSSNFSFSDAIPKQSDNQISLVDEGNYNSSQVNHLSNRNSTRGLQQSLPQPQQRRLDHNEMNSDVYNDNDIGNPLYEEMAKQRSHLSELLKMRSNELDEANSKLAEKEKQLNQLQLKYTELVSYSNDLKRQNEKYEIELKYQSSMMASMKNEDMSTKMLREKDLIISRLQDELKFLKEKSPLYHPPNAAEKLNENNYLSMKIDELIAQYTKESSQHQRKHDELLKANEMLNETIKTLIKEKTAQSMEYHSIISSYDKRLLDSLSKYPKSFDGVNARKEDAAKFLVEQIEEYLKDKERLVNENISMRSDISILKAENCQLKSELNSLMTIKTHNQTPSNELYSVIQSQIDQKTNEINALKAKLKSQPIQSFKNP